MADKVITYSTEGGVGIVTIDRPPANSYDMSFMQDLDAAVESAAQDDNVKVVLVRSASEKFFCAGADIKAFRANSVEENMTMIAFAHETLAMISHIPKIFIAVVGGHAYGGGLEIGLACDLRFAGDGNFQMGLSEVKLGLLPGNGGTQRLPRLIGKAKALSMMIMGETVSPQQALEVGIVDKVFPQDKLWDESLAYAQALAGGATAAVANIKRAVTEGIGLPLTEGLRLERDLMAELFETEDATEGITAFAEKRQANFKGK